MSSHFGSMACPACGGPAVGASTGQTAPAWSTGFSPEWTGAYAPFGPMWGPHFPPSSALSRQWMYSHLHIEDERLGEIVGSAIANDPMIPPQANIDVEVSDGVITLTGTVPNKLVKHAAGDDAWYTPGVWDVHNNLEVVALHKARRRTARRAEH